MHQSHELHCNQRLSKWKLRNQLKLAFPLGFPRLKPPCPFCYWFYVPWESLISVYTVNCCSYLCLMVVLRVLMVIGWYYYPSWVMWMDMMTIAVFLHSIVSFSIRNWRTPTSSIVSIVWFTRGSRSKAAINGLLHYFSGVSNSIQQTWSLFGTTQTICSTPSHTQPLKEGCMLPFIIPPQPYDLVELVWGRTQPLKHYPHLLGSYAVVVGHWTRKQVMLCAFQGSFKCHHKLYLFNCSRSQQFCHLMLQTWVGLP